jgi:cytochrome P450
MIEAGSETTSSTLNSCLLYLLANPAIQKTAHTELGTILPPDRGPTFSDEPHLPYIRAIVKEILRLRPVANIGGPRNATRISSIKICLFLGGRISRFFSMRYSILNRDGRGQRIIR